MSTFRTPVGPQPSSVYWRRRLVVFLGLLAVIAIIVLIFSKPGAAAPADVPVASQSTDASDETEPIAEPEEEPVDGAECDPADVAIIAVTDADGYDEGELPQLSFSISNEGDEACIFNVGSTQQVFTVSSADDSYWTSTDCATDPVDAAVLLEPGVAQNSTPIEWDRTRSSVDTCGGERSAAPSGGATYTLAVTVGEAEPAATKSFLLN